MSNPGNQPGNPPTAPPLQGTPIVKFKSKFPFAEEYDGVFGFFSRNEATGLRDWSKEENAAAAATKDWLKDLWTVFGVVVRAACIQC